MNTIFHLIIWKIYSITIDIDKPFYFWNLLTECDKINIRVFILMKCLYSSLQKVKKLKNEINCKLRAWLKNGKFLTEPRKLLLKLLFVKVWVSWFSLESQPVLLDGVREEAYLCDSLFDFYLYIGLHDKVAKKKILHGLHERDFKPASTRNKQNAACRRELGLTSHFLVHLDARVKVKTQQVQVKLHSYIRLGNLHQRWISFSLSITLRSSIILKVIL